jgi:glycosyltransferase involved in cell wall biosynthesis
MGYRIVLLTKECSVTGGVGSYIENLSNALDSAGHHVTIIHSDARPSIAIANNVRRLYAPHFDEFDRLEISQDRAHQVLAMLQSIQPDIVHVQCNNNFILEKQIRSQFTALKFLHVYDFCPSGNKFHHALGQPCLHPTGALCVPRMGYKRCMLTKRPWVIWNHYRRCVDANRNNAACLRLIVASQHVKEQAVASGYSPSKIEVLPYFVQLPPFSTATEGDGKTILFVGRVTREKGLEFLLRALISMRASTRLIVAGAGADWDRAKRLSRKLGLSHRTEFLGWVDARDLASLYASSTVVAVPSVWPEPFGIVGIEAMSYGKPVVAFRVGGIPEWLEDGVTGFTVTPYDVNEMATRLTYLLDHPQVAREMGLCGRRLAEDKFNPERHIARLIEISREVIDARACAATPAG